MPSMELPNHHGEEQKTTMIQTQLSRIERFQTVAEVFKQLGDTTRIRIFWLLCHCEECVVNISAMLEMSSPAVSHHLRPLRNSGLIVCRRDGKEVYYRAANIPQSQLLHQMIEQVMEITCPEQPPISLAHEENHQPELAEIVREIHDRLLENLDRKITIEELSKQYHMNPTTLKTAFKAVYGTSLAAHIKEHRMEQAAKLLKETDMSIAEIALAVGYDSQSKFTAAFKAFFQVLPKEYRRRCPSSRTVPGPDS